MRGDGGQDRVGGELDWLAFQYVAGEFSPEETSSFEERLANDQLAREAVAAAVEWSQAAAEAFQAVAAPPAEIVVAARAPAVPGWQRWSRRLSWISCGLAAGVALTLMLADLLRPGSAGMSPGTAAVADTPRLAAEAVRTRELVVAWMQAQSRLDLEIDAAPETEPVDEGFYLGTGPGPSGLGVDGDTDDEVAGIETPSWMLHAVAIRNLDEDGETPRVE